MSLTSSLELCAANTSVVLNVFGEMGANAGGAHQGFVIFRLNGVIAVHGALAEPDLHSLGGWVVSY